MAAAPRLPIRRGARRLIDTIAMLRFFADTSHRFATKLGASANRRAVAQRIGIAPSREIYTWNGGNMPQYLVNFLERIARGEMKAAIIVGGEALRTQHRRERAGISGSLNEDPGGSGPN